MVGKRPAPSAVDELLGRSMRLMHEGKVEEAERALREARSLSPGHAEAAHLHGLLCLQNGRTSEAVRLLGRATRAAPDRPDVWLNYANALAISDQPAEAEAALRRVLELDPEDLRAGFNLGVVLARSGRAEEAVAILKVVATSRPEPDAYAELGLALGRLKRHEEAAAAFREGLSLAPEDTGLRAKLSRACFHIADALERRLAPADVVLAHVRDWLQVDPKDPIAQHMLAAYGGAEAPARCSDGYVVRTFDQFAASFDAVLEKLRYTGVADSVTALDAALGDRQDLTLLDAGCGTGALAPLVRDRCKRLVGVDLSPKMIARCEERGGYHELATDEITTYLGNHQASFDAVVSADTVIYFGDVKPLFEVTIAALRPNGVFIFTAETLEDAAAAPYVLTTFGRYAHRRSYLEEVLREAGARVEAVTRVDSIRIEHGVPIPALIVTARRPVP